MHCHGNKLKMDFPIHPFLIPRCSFSQICNFDITTKPYDTIGPGRQLRPFHHLDRGRAQEGRRDVRHHEERRPAEEGGN